MGKGLDSGNVAALNGSTDRAESSAASSQLQLRQSQAQVAAYSDAFLRLMHGSFLQQLCGGALDWVQWFLARAAKDGKENIYLSGNFAPVPECPGVSTGLRIEGTLPDYINGEFVRTGPNPKYKPAAGYHWFDGDGMLHGVRMKDGEASYVNRFVKTSRLKQEDAAGKFLFLKVGDMKGFNGLIQIFLELAYKTMGVRDYSDGLGTANTALVYHSGSLLALNEGDKPYAVRVLEDGDLETVGRRGYGGTLDHNFTAHPKVDPVTGEMFFFCYNVERAPYCFYRVVSPSGAMSSRVSINLPEPIMMHDFAVSKNYAIFMDLPVTFDIKAMVKRNTIPFAWKERPARFGLLPRHDANEANIKWFTRPSCSILHNANAWDDGDETVLIGCRYDKMEINLSELQSPGYLTEFRFNMKTGESSETKLADVRCDFPRINENFACRKQRFVYTSVFDGLLDIIGVAKFDVSRAQATGGTSDYQRRDCHVVLFPGRMCVWVLRPWERQDWI